MAARKAPEPGGDLALGPTSGVLTGWLAELLALGLLVSTLINHRDLDGLRLGLGALLGGALAWSFLLRARVVLRASDLLLRNAYVDTTVPYTMVNRVVVRSVTNVWVGEKRYVSSAVGRSARQMIRAPRGAMGASGLPSGRMAAAETPPTTSSRTDISDVANFLEAQVTDRVTRARDWPGAPEGLGGEIRRAVAWPEVAVTAALAVAFVVSLLV